MGTPAAMVAVLLAAGCAAVGPTDSSTPAGSPVSAAVPTMAAVATRGADGTCFVPAADDVSTPHGLVFVDAAPTGVVLEWLPGLNDRNCRAVLSRRGTAAARELAVLIDAAPAFPPGAFSCPADDGTAVLLVFEFTSRPAEQATAELTGCRGIDAPGRRRRTLPDELTTALRPGAPSRWRALLRAPLASIAPSAAGEHCSERRRRAAR